MRPNQIEQLMNQGETSRSSAFVNISMSLMSNLNMSLSEIKELPIPLAFEYMRILQEENKKLEKQIKNG